MAWTRYWPGGTTTADHWNFCSNISTALVTITFELGSVCPKELTAKIFRATVSLIVGVGFPTVHVISSGTHVDVLVIGERMKDVTVLVGEGETEVEDAEVFMGTVMIAEVEKTTIFRYQCCAK